MSFTTTTYHDIQVPNGVKVHYAQAGQATNPTILLLPGFPSSSFQYRGLIPLLSDKYHVLSPDLPGFGHTTLPAGFKPTFSSITSTIGQFLDALKIDKFVSYCFDYGAPVTWRLALDRPEAIKAIIAQNGNAYERGLSEWWDPLKTWWASGNPNNNEIRQALGQAALSIESVKQQYVAGVPTDRLSRIDPSTWTLDTLQNLTGKDKQDIQLDLFFDYGSNLAVYPKVHEWFRKSQVPLLAVWGKNDVIFPGETSAKAFLDDLPNAEIHLLDGGHFLLETHLEEVAAYIRNFLQNIKW
ncbi:alpha/beta hydrolase fold protein [Naematelia encephala]|uniref:Alpha/beta hydrolase fold protein n=1 Tax=Naematelia encephala TaxID=71784 RepID=A0A1Y2BH91_9TREE|nr:alpha/beta hydrolase fold protein [Naematelia encephala]